MAKVKNIRKLMDEVVEDEDPVDVTPSTPIPLETEVGWSDYVMGFFDPSELSDGKPRVHGLRRVVKLIFDNIKIPTNADLVDTPSEYNGRRYVAKYSVEIDGIVYQDLGDCPVGDGYAQYPAALACTRAEARVYRKLLNLNVCSAEEISNDEVKEENVWKPDSDHAFITSTQANYINTIAKKIGVKLDDLLKEHGVTTKLSEVTSDVATSLISTLNERLRSNANT